MDPDLTFPPEVLDGAPDHLGTAFRVQIDRDAVHRGRCTAQSLERERGHLIGPENQYEMLPPRVTAAEQIQVAQLAGDVAGGVQQLADSPSGIQQFRRNDAAVRCVDDLSGAGSKVAEPCAAVAGDAYRHPHPVAIADCLRRGQCSRDVYVGKTVVIPELPAKNSPFALQLLAIAHAEHAAGTAILLVGAGPS